MTALKHEVMRELVVPCDEIRFGKQNPQKGLESGFAILFPLVLNKCEFIFTILVQPPITIFRVWAPLSPAQRNTRPISESGVTVQYDSAKWELRKWEPS